MKTITRDTLRALMSKDPETNLKLCGYTDEDIQNHETMYKALHDCAICASHEAMAQEYKRERDAALIARQYFDVRFDRIEAAIRST